jgi:hypothetical protein
MGKHSLMWCALSTLFETRVGAVGMIVASPKQDFLCGRIPLAKIVFGPRLRACRILLPLLNAQPRLMNDRQRPMIEWRCSSSGMDTKMQRPGSWTERAETARGHEGS